MSIGSQVNRIMTDGMKSDFNNKSQFYMDNELFRRNKMCQNVLERKFI